MQKVISHIVSIKHGTHLTSKDWESSNKKGLLLQITLDLASGSKG